MAVRRYPIGIQTFSRIIREGYVYIDKTDLIWHLAHYATFVFMSRPRRFGKILCHLRYHRARGERPAQRGYKSHVGGLWLLARRDVREDKTALRRIPLCISIR